MKPMKMQIMALAAASAGLCAVPARASVDWNADPAAAAAALFKAEIVEARMARPAGDLVRTPVLLEATPVDDNRLDVMAWQADIFQIDVSLTLNNTKDRVGALATVSGGEDDQMTVQYAFPQLRYDAATNSVHNGNELVATMKGGGLFGGWPKLENGYTLKYAQVTEPYDTGFDRRNHKVLKVWLVRR